MGRTEKSQGLAPPAIRKDMRAKQARHIVNKTIPAILASNAKAMRGANGSELITDPGIVAVTAESGVKEKGERGGDEEKYIKRKGQGRRKAKAGVEEQIFSTEEQDRIVKEKDKRKGKNGPIDDSLAQLSIAQTAPTKRTIRVVTTDTLTAAQMLATASSSPRKRANVCILNMASPLRPGGGVFTGATSQEEFLCARTTLLSSLKEEFYRLPEYGGVYTRDVLVFRSSLSLGDAKGETAVTERWWVDVVSAGMLRFPELEGEEDEEKRLSKRDRIIVERKMRAVLRIASMKGAQRLVLGAWGCGAYGNPVRNIAEIWRKVVGDSTDSDCKRSKGSGPSETWLTIKEIVFAIPNMKMAHDFARAFGNGLEVEAGPETNEEDDEEGDADNVAEELRTKIKEMESQLEKVWNVDLKSRMSTIIEGLRAQLRKREEGSQSGRVDEESDDEASVDEDTEATPEEEHEFNSDTKEESNRWER